MKPPQSGVVKLYRRDLMMSSGWTHGQSDILGKSDHFYTWKVDFQKSRSRSKLAFILWGESRMSGSGKMYYRRIDSRI